MKNTTRLLLAALVCTGMVACAKKVKEAPAEPMDTTDTTQTTQSTDSDVYTVEDLDTDSCLRQRVVYFDFDRAEIKSEFQAIMGCHGKYLRDRPSAAMTLEGHADERGTREYNLGLGERRGNAVQSALSSAGASSGQLNVVSYGEERPTCKDHDEGCWSKNRRVEIVYTAK